MGYDIWMNLFCWFYIVICILKSVVIRIYGFFYRDINLLNGYSM